MMLKVHFSLKKPKKRDIHPGHPVFKFTLILIKPL